MKKKILSNKQIEQLSTKTKLDLYFVLLNIEDELGYNCKKISNTINFLQKNKRREVRKMKINGQEVVGNKFAFDGCHKIYIIENNNDMEEAQECGYAIYDIKVLQACYENSCDLRFISNWNLDKQYVKQFEETVKFE